MQIVIIDNYDSFTYNLVQAFESLGAGVTVWRNDAFSLADLRRFDRLVLSPGPGVPAEAGFLLDVVREYAAVKPILGICLGEQAIGQVYGARLVNLPAVFHGVQTPAEIIEPDYVFEGLPRRIQVAATIRGWWTAPHFRPAWKLRLSVRRVTSWPCAIASTTSAAYSFTPSLSSRPAAWRCFGTGCFIMSEK